MRGSKVVQWCCKFSRVRNVVTENIDESEKRSHLTNRLLRRSVSVYAQLCGIKGDARCRNDVTEVQHLMSKQRELRRFQF